MNVSVDAIYGTHLRQPSTFLRNSNPRSMILGSATYASLSIHVAISTTGMIVSGCLGDYMLTLQKEKLLVVEEMKSISNMSGRL